MAYLIVPRTAFRFKDDAHPDGGAEYHLRTFFDDNDMVMACGKEGAPDEFAPESISKLAPGELCEQCFVSVLVNADEKLGVTLAKPAMAYRLRDSSETVGDYHLRAANDDQNYVLSCGQMASREELTYGIIADLDPSRLCEQCFGIFDIKPYNDEAIPETPAGPPPEMRVELTDEAIAELHAELHAELTANLASKTQSKPDEKPPLAALSPKVAPLAAPAPQVSTSTKPPASKKLLFAGLFAVAVAVSATGYFLSRGPSASPVSSPADLSSAPVQAQPINPPKPVVVAPPPVAVASAPITAIPSAPAQEPKSSAPVKIEPAPTPKTQPVPVAPPATAQAAKPEPPAVSHAEPPPAPKAAPQAPPVVREETIAPPKPESATPQAAKAEEPPAPKPEPAQTAKADAGDYSPFPDDALDACVRKTMNLKPDDPYTREKFLELRKLNCSEKGIKSIAGIERLIKLEELNLNDNAIVDISPLAKLPATCDTINLLRNPIEDITPLLMRPK